ncbi:MAG: cation-transporting P-type ATPase [Gammaproteobacteria bacterium]|nr:cation-transporting P-type ATPase [Gammaproteobacteria bacterium]
METQTEHHYFELSVDEALQQLRTDRAAGLTDAEVQARQERHGRNVLAEAPPVPPIAMLLGQFKDLIIIVLMVATGIAYYLQDYRGGTVLLLIILVNAVIGAYQEYKAERVLEKLRTMIRSAAVVIRGGEQREVDSADLVPGDIVVLEEGAAVPADLRLIEANGFSTNDFVLTGESVPQDKDTEAVADGDAPLSEQDNLVFLGTSVARGNAVGAVFATGMRTEIGRIARISETIKRDKSPLQLEIDELARTLTRLAGVIALALFGLNMMLRGDQYETVALLVNGSLLFAIGVAAACVPQGMPAQISVALSLGVGRLARKQAVVKRLSAVETLGSTTVICSDKTGTITTNEMTITHCWINGLEFEVTGVGYDPEGAIHGPDTALSDADKRLVQQVVQGGFLGSSGRTHPPDGEHATWYAIGDPTDAAFTPLAVKAGLDPEQLEDEYREAGELPFDSERKRMTLLHEHNGRLFGYMKGATESVLDACGTILKDGKAVPLTEAERQAVLEKVQQYSAESLRVIALAVRELPGPVENADPELIERDFMFTGVVAMIDLPRKGVREAIRSVNKARVRVVMITGDDPVTAEAIARRIGMEEGRVLTGEEVSGLKEEQLVKLLRDRALIFSRVSPEDKYRVVSMLRKMGDVVAATGDGVNDTLSLKKAHIGVAMGKRGSEVAKEAAEIVLLDDNFSTLVSAIREGRIIYQNLSRVILSSITSNLGELAVVCFGFIGVAAGMPIPITAVQILAIDLIGEMLPLMALTFDPAEATIMRDPPRQLGQHIVNRRSLLELFADGILMGAAGYLSFYMVQHTGGSLATAQAATYTSIILVQFGNILSHRSRGTMFSPYLFANPRMWQALAVSSCLVLAIVNIPAIGAWFGFAPLRPQDWVWPLTGLAVFIAWFELKKLLFYRNPPAGPAR